MEESRPSKTPAGEKALGSDKLGDDFDQEWEYATIVGMLMYLSTNTRPDIAFAVHQCARFTHAPRQSHAVAIKKILRYLAGTKDKGIRIKPTEKLEVDCYVDADFAGLWGVENDQEPVSVKSRTGFVITFMGCPLLWTSKLQTMIALSTMEAEYIALSTSIRELIATRSILQEIGSITLHDNTSPTLTAHSTVFKLPQSQIFEDNESWQKFAMMPKISPRTKHIAIQYHFFRTKVADLDIKVVSIGTDDQLGDHFTKCLPLYKFNKFRKILMRW